MKTLNYISILIGTIFFTTSVQAQLPANPWDKSAQSVAHVKREVPVSKAKIVKYAPVNAEKEAPVYKPAIDSAGKSKAVVQTGNVATPAKAETSEVVKKAASQKSAAVGKSQSWIGSGNYGKLNYSGEATTYGTAYGQEMIAPEVNAGNIKIMIQHLRNMGYKIPESYDNKFENFLQDYSKELSEAYSGIGRQNNPLDTMFSGMLDVFEHGSGLDVENLLFNSIGLISGGN